MIRNCALLTIASMLSVAHAATVAPDALLCEAPEPFQVIASEGWTSRGGVAQLNTAKLSAEGFRLSGQLSGAKQGLASQEEAIRADSTLRLAAGSTNSRAVAASSESSSAAAKVAVYERIASTCAASGASALPAEILERKPISGAARVRVAFRGAPAELWVRTSDLTE